MKEGTPVLQHLNTFNQNLSDLLALEVKLEEEDKTLLLLSFLPQSYDHLATAIICEKAILDHLQGAEKFAPFNKLKDVRGFVLQGAEVLSPPNSSPYKCLLI